MRLYQKYFPCNYDELITYYPKFYRDVLEMQAILEAHGAVIDTLEDNIERTFFNSFIDTADEQTIKEWERFLEVNYSGLRTLNERRNAVKAFFVGFGKVSASQIKRIIAAFTEDDADIDFKAEHEQGNNLLHIRISHNTPTAYQLSDVIDSISRKIPAHIASAVEVMTKPRTVSLRVGVRGAIISRLTPTEQPDNLSGRQTLRAGGQLSVTAQQPTREQPDNLRAAQTVHTGGRLAGVAKLPPIEQADDLSARRTLHTGGQTAAIANPAPVEQPDNLPAEHSIRHGGRPAVVSVMRGRQVSE